MNEQRVMAVCGGSRQRRSRQRRLSPLPRLPGTVERHCKHIWVAQAAGLPQEGALTAPKLCQALRGLTPC